MANCPLCKHLWERHGDPVCTAHDGYGNPCCCTAKKPLDELMRQVIRDLQAYLRVKKTWDNTLFELRALKKSLAEYEAAEAKNNRK